MLDFFPSLIVGGVTLRQELVLSDYPAPTWSVSVILRGPASIDLTSVADGAAHLVSALPATTSGWAEGEYAYSLRVSDGTDVLELESGTIEVRADIVGLAAGHDAKSAAKKALENINAVLEARATKDQQSYSINGRSLVRMSVADLLVLKKHFEKQVLREQRGGKGRKLLRRKVNVRY